MYAIPDTLAAQRWLRLIDNAGLERQRLRLGMTILRNQKIVRATVGFEQIEVLIAGSYWDVYTARVRGTAFPAALWEQVIEALAQNQVALAHVLAGQLTEQVEHIFTGLGARLFPTSLAELEGRCTCRNPEQPCKHLVALHYFFAEQLQKNPFLIFTFRGRMHDDLTEQLRTAWVVSQMGMDGDLAEGANQADPHAATPLRASRFYSTGAAFETALGATSAIPEPPDTPALLLRRVGRPPFVGQNEDPAAILTPVYELATKRATDALKTAEKSRQWNSKHLKERQSNSHPG